MLLLNFVNFSNFCSPGDQPSGKVANLKSSGLNKTLRYAVSASSILTK